MKSSYSIRFYEPMGGRGLVPMLCDADGNALPNQQSVVIKAEVNDIPTATVVFNLGDDLPILID